MSSPAQSSPNTSPPLDRELGFWQASALNMANMVGIGPFITIPSFIAAMQGPHAIIAWVMAALLVLCDGLVWAELGAALPGSGGSYHYLREIFGRYRWGRILPFLFIWQFLVSGALELASGYVGAMGYVQYAIPQLDESLKRWGISNGSQFFAAAAVVAVTALLCQRIKNIGWLGIILCIGTLITVISVIVLGLTHFDASLLSVPPQAFTWSPQFATGLGAAMAIAIYDYFGYFNVCHLGEEVRNPGKTIPRSILVSILVIAALYLTMNVAIMGVIPWQEAMESKHIASDFVERICGRQVAIGFTGLILWTSLACMFAATLAYSRIPYAAAQGGDFFAFFGKLHPTKRFPWVSLIVMGLFTMIFCFIPLEDLVSAAVCVRIGIQFMGQVVALHLYRSTHTPESMPFRMWLYPLPSLIAFFGWAFLLATSKGYILLFSLIVIATGILAYGIRHAMAAKRSPAP
ncbi:MAG: APC family permease [Pirellulales bacterium]